MLKLLMSRKKITPLCEIEGNEIPIDKDGYVSLTALWRAAGSDPNKAPYEWLRQDEVLELLEIIEEEETVTGSNRNTKRRQPIKTRTGRSKAYEQGTWAIEIVAIKYGEYLSARYGLRVARGFREFEREKHNPDLKAKRAIEGYQAQGKSLKWVGLRLDGIVERKKFCSVLQKRGVKGPGWGSCTNGIYKSIGGTAKSLVRLKGLTIKQNLRDHLTDVELAAVQLSEVIATQEIEEKNARGNKELIKECKKAGNRVNRIFEKDE